MLPNAAVGDAAEGGRGARGEREDGAGALGEGRGPSDVDEVREGVRQGLDRRAEVGVLREARGVDQGAAGADAREGHLGERGEAHGLGRLHGALGRVDEEGAREVVRDPEPEGAVRRAHGLGHVRPRHAQHRARRRKHLVQVDPLPQLIQALHARAHQPARPVQRVVARRVVRVRARRPRAGPGRARGDCDVEQVRPLASEVDADEDAVRVAGLLPLMRPKQPALRLEHRVRAPRRCVPVEREAARRARVAPPQRKQRRELPLLAARPSVHHRGEGVARRDVPRPDLLDDAAALEDQHRRWPLPANCPMRPPDN